jgi:hypothetical protein
MYSTKDRIEKSLLDYQIQSNQYSWLHTEDSSLFNTRNKIINIANIVVTSLSATTSVVTTSLFSKDIKAVDAVNIFTAVLLYLVSILSSLQHFLEYEKKAENHRTASLRFNSMSNNIKRTLVLDHENQQALLDYYKWVSTEFENIVGSTPVFSSSSIAKFEKNFGVELKKINSTEMIQGEDDSVRINNIGYSEELRMQYEIDRFLVNSYNEKN